MEINGILLSIICFLLAALWIGYKKVEVLLLSMEQMVDDAIDGTLTEKYFSEDRLSRLEAKLYRYLSLGSISKRQLTEQKEATEELVGNISHQTKTPIANILLYSQLLSEAFQKEDLCEEDSGEENYNRKEELQREERELAKQIEQQAEKLNFLIQSLIKLSRLENGMIVLVPKIQQVRHLFAGLYCSVLAKEKQIAVELPEVKAGITAFFDGKWTKEALYNVLDNAVKYTPSGGRVSVSVQEYEMFVRIDVADTGIGIAEEDIAKIFLRFYRSPCVSEEKGTGIGLYLAREIVGKEGGYIKVSSKIGKGSVFSIYLSKQINLSKL